VDLLSKNGDACCEAKSGRSSQDGTRDERAAGVSGDRLPADDGALSLRGAWMILPCANGWAPWQERRRFGYRRLLIFLRREGFIVNHAFCGGRNWSIFFGLNRGHSLAKCEPNESEHHQDGSGYDQPVRIFHR
jgi:hypothetical protein